MTLHAPLANAEVGVGVHMPHPFDFQRQPLVAIALEIGNIQNVNVTDGCVGYKSPSDGTR
jgi:hypothetical protein